MRLLAGSLVGASLSYGAMAQSNQQLVLAGVSPGVGIGAYNALGASVELNVRYQHPVSGKLALIGKTGLEVFSVKGRYANLFRKEYQTLTGFSIPLTVGPRYYFFDNLYAELNLGADIGISQLALTAFRFEPGVGLMLPLPGGRYLDVGSTVATSFSRGSGLFAFHIAYGMRLN